MVLDVGLESSAGQSSRQGEAEAAGGCSSGGRETGGVWSGLQSIGAAIIIERT